MRSARFSVWRLPKLSLRVAKILYTLLALALLPAVVAAQLGPGAPAQDTTTRPVIIDFAETFEYIVEDTATIQRLEGEVELRQDSTFIYCDEARIVNDSFVMARGNVVILQNDTINTFADSVEYYAGRQIAYLYGEVVLVNGAQQLFTDTLRYDLAAKRATYWSRAKLTDGESQLSSIRGSYDVEASYATFKDSVFVVREDFNLIADTLNFDTDQSIVYFDGPTVMATPESRVYCEDGFYRLQDTTGRFSQNAQVARGTQRAAADTIWYYGQRDLFVLQGDAKFADGERRAAGQRIEYDERVNRTVLFGDATFREGDKNVAGDRIDYDGNTQTFVSSGQIRISEPPFLLAADSLSFDELSGIAHVRGNVVWRDTATQRSITADFVDYRSEGDYVKAFGGRPVFSTVVEEDTLFMSADTLLTFLEPVPIDSAERVDSALVSLQLDSLSSDSMVVEAQVADTLLTEEAIVIGDSLRSDLRPLPLDSVRRTELAGSRSDSSLLADTTQRLALAPSNDSVRLLLAYPTVRIYKSNLQAVCDSLAYNSIDSAFTLYRDPIMWSDTSQFLADTVAIRLSNNQIDRVKLRSKALIVNSPDEQFFNQIKGRTVDVHFAEGEVDRMYVRGNAESVYYILDEAKAYVGLNHVRSARMRMQFTERELSDIYFYDSPAGDLTPLAPVGEQPKLLEDFRWETELRPLGKEDL